MQSLGIREWRRGMHEKGIEVIDIPPRIRNHNYTETNKRRLEEREK